MKKTIFFLLLFLICSWTFKALGQSFTTSADSLLATFEIKNKKAVQVQPNTATAKFLAQRNATDLLYILDNFFSTDLYRKDRPIKIRQYTVNAKLSNDDRVADSFLSIIYILDIPGAVAYSERLKADTFLKVKSGPSKIPEQFYLGRLDDQRLMLVSMYAPLQKEEADAIRRQQHIYTYLDWLREQYR